LLLLLSAALAAPDDDAREHLARLSGFPEADLEARVFPWPGGDRVRLTPRLAGLPVAGRESVVVLDAAGAPRRVVGPLPAAAAAPSTRPALPRAAAIERAAAALPAGRDLWPPRASLAFWWGGVEPRLAWAVAIGRADPPATWRLYVDALTGDVLHRRPTSATADALVYPQSPAISEPEVIALGGLYGGDRLEGEYATPFSCAHPSPFGQPLDPSSCDAYTRHAQADGAGDYLYEPDPGALDDPMAEVMLYHHLDLMSAWLWERYGLSLGGPIRAYANFELINAFFGDSDGDGVGDVSFGQSPDGVDFAYDADVIYHELGHAVVAATAGLGAVGADAYGMDWGPGSLNEGTADALALVLTGDPWMGDYAGTFGDRDQPIRDLDQGQRCPDYLWGEVHRDGEIWGAMTWGLMEALGAEAAGDLVYGALTTWQWDTSWGEAGASLLAAADDLAAAGLLSGGELDAVAAVVEAHGLVDCERLVPLGGEAEHAQRIGNLGMIGDFALLPAGSQYVVEVPEGSAALRVEITGFEAEHEDLAWTMMVRRGDIVEHEAIHVDTLGVSLAVPRVFDFAIEGEGAGVAFELSGDSDPPLRPGGSYYVALAGRSLGGIEFLEYVNAEITLSATVDRVVLEKEEPKCSCAAGPRGGWWALPLAALFWRRRNSSDV